MNRPMTALAFDTHQAVKDLQQAGADEALAEAVVATVGNALGESVATKDDLKHLEHRLTIRLGGIMAVGIGVLVAIMTLFQFGID